MENQDSSGGESTILPLLKYPLSNPAISYKLGTQGQAKIKCFVCHSKDTCRVRLIGLD